MFGLSPDLNAVLRLLFAEPDSLLVLFSTSLVIMSGRFADACYSTIRLDVNLLSIFKRGSSESNHEEQARLWVGDYARDTAYRCSLVLSTAATAAALLYFIASRWNDIALVPVFLAYWYSWRATQQFFARNANPYAMRDPAIVFRFLRIRKSLVPILMLVGVNLALLCLKVVSHLTMDPPS